MIGGFPCYKAGTTHVEMIDDSPHTLTSGQSVVKVATVLEAPPVVVFGVRAYEKGYGGLRSAADVLHTELSKDLSRVIRMPKRKLEGIERIEGMVESIAEIRLLVHTQPRLVSALGKKKPEVLEMTVAGGSVEEKLSRAAELLGSELKVSEALREGEYVDTLSITKGKGFQGALKKWGVKHLPRKTRKGRRTAGTLGPWNPSAMMWTVPQSGQMGYHQRTEFNKRVLKIGSDGSEVTPAGGFLHYGVVKNDYVVLSGSTPGPQKRLVILRQAVRARARAPTSKPQILSISTASMQGV